MPLKIGQQAPDFSLFDSEKNKINLGDFRGNKNVLLLFFPLAFTSVCTAQLCYVRDDIAKFENEQVQVLGISVDSVYTLAKFKADQKYNYPLLSDFNKEVSIKYETLHESFTMMEMKGVSKRSGFIINKMGWIEYAEVMENPTELPDFKAISETLLRLSV